MKILFVSNRSAYFKNPFGGAEISFKVIAEEMAERGHQISYLTKRFDPKFELGAKSETINSVKVTSVNFFNADYSKDRKPPKWAGSLNGFQSSVFSNTLHRIVRKNHIELVYCFYELNIINKLLDLKARGLPVKIVMRIAGHHWYEQCKKNPDLVAQYETAFNAVDSVNFLHEKMEQEVVEKLAELQMNVRFRHTFVADIGSSAQKGRQINYRPSDGQEFHLIMAARFSSYQKRQDLLVRAMALIPPDLPVKLTLLGEGVRKPEIEDLIVQLNVSHRVFVEPFCQQADLWQKLAQAQLLCHACEYEGVSKIIVESLSMGVPVLVSEVEPINQYIQDGFNGLLVENTPEAWADKITYLYHHQDLLEKLSKSSIESVKDRYDPKVNGLIYEENFQNLLK